MIKFFKHFWELLRLEQTLFSLPFCYASMILAAKGIPNVETVFWVTIAMISARTFGMSINRIFDKDIDALNPRTSNRPLASGRVQLWEVALIVFVSLFALLYATFHLPRICWYFLPVAILLLIVYSLLKRFTWLCHFWLGFIQACGPVGSWLAIREEFEFATMGLAIAIGCWISGFDILYACQDTEFDRKSGLFSLPAAIGNERAFQVAKLLHVLSITGFLMVGWSLELSLVYYTGIGIIGALFVWEHELLAPDDLSRIDVAFFNVNAGISTTFLITVLMEALWRGWLNLW